MVCRHICRVSSQHSKAFGSRPLRFDEVPAGREPQCRLCSSVFLPVFFFPDSRPSHFCCPVFAPRLPLFDFTIISSYLEANSWLLSVSSFQKPLGSWPNKHKNLTTGRNFFHPRTMEGMTWGCLKGSPLYKVSMVFANSESSPFLPLDTTKQYFKISCYTAVQRNPLLDTQNLIHTLRFFFLVGKVKL